MEDKIELAVNTGLQLIPYVGSLLATLYFGVNKKKDLKESNKHCKKLQKILKNVPLPSIEQHNEE